MNKFVCITGADRGVGFELVKTMLLKGDIVFAGRYLKENQELNSLKEKYKDQLFLVDIDISKDSSVKKAFEYIASITDHVDILVNNGAILGDIKATISDELDFDEIEKVYSVNTVGALRMTNVMLPLIMKSESKLIANISSEASSITNCERTSWFAYCMSKSAINMQSAIVHNTIKAEGGQVIVIHPGWVKTYMQGKLDEDAELTPKASAASISNILIEADKYKGDKPAFVDYLGISIEW